MLSSFDLVKLNALLKDFYNLTHIRITIFDDRYQEITSFPRQVAPICRFIRSDASAETSCITCDREACRRASESRLTYIYRCHAGLTEAVAPVFMGNIVIAYLLFGHLFCYSSRDVGRREIISNCQKYDLDLTLLNDMISELPDTSEDYILSAVHILEAVASYLCLDKMITLKQQGLHVQIDKYIAEHFTEDIGADAICQRFNIGRTALYEFSKQNYGMGIAKHIRNLRIEYAKQLLAEKNEFNISQIAEACGFADYNYFITVFSQTTGISPRKYRLQQTSAAND